MDALKLKSGDLLGFCGGSIVSHVINIGTFGLPGRGLSHVGIVAEYDGDLVLFESTTLAAEGSACIIANKIVQGVQAHHLDDVLSRKDRIYHYSLTRPLYSDEALRLSRYLLHSAGAPYDMRGAVRSGGLLYRFLNYMLRPEELDSVFCSELCASALSRVGVMPTSNSSSYNPNSLVRRGVREGVLSYQGEIK